EPAGGAADRLVAGHRAVAHLGVHKERVHAAAGGAGTRRVAQGHIAADGAAGDAEVRGCRGAEKSEAKIELVIDAAACGPEGENVPGRVAADGAVGDETIPAAGPDAAAKTRAGVTFDRETSNRRAAEGLVAAQRAAGDH